jgi:putative endonuclease
VNRRALGTAGETVARAHLERLGWRILAANWRCPAGEIDLIAEEPQPTGRCIVFVEVKTRTKSLHGSPAEAVDARKRQKLAAVALAWLSTGAAGSEEPHCRFDIVEVFPHPDGRWSVEMHRGAFDAGA